MVDVLYRRALDILGPDGDGHGEEEGGGRKELEEIRAAVQHARPPHLKFRTRGYVPYPDIGNPDMQLILARKAEFAATAQREIVPANRSQDAIGAAWGEACGASASSGFRLSHTQQFLRKLIGPNTPYNSLLLFHGVGVGKTCSAVTIAEGFPDRRALVIVDPALRANFMREVFDVDAFLAKRPLSCAGPRYAQAIQASIGKAAAAKTTTDDALRRKAQRLIAQKYKFMGFREFATTVTRMGEGPDGDDRIRKAFSRYVIIVDEAHHLCAPSSSNNNQLHDTNEEGEVAGKVATPVLRRLLKCVDDAKLILLTATPMFNSSRDFLDLLNILLLNEKRGRINVPDVFDSHGRLRDAQRLQAAANGLVSYVQGYSPFSFPLRLFPDVDSKQKEPTSKNKVIRPDQFPTLDEKGRTVSHVPSTWRFYASTMTKTQAKAYAAFEHAPGDSQGSGSGSGSGSSYEGSLPSNFGSDTGLMQVCNVAFPIPELLRSSEGRGRVDFWQAFQRVGGPASFRVQYAPNIPTFLDRTHLRQYAPKMDAVVRKASSAEGIVFVYTKYIKSGALPLAIALEHAGFKRHGAANILFSGGPEGTTSPGTYTIVCGDPSITRDIKAEVAVLRSDANARGERIKVVVVTEVATEGIDLRNVREVHVLDPWYHMNKVEQIVGRASRLCSHARLPLARRNMTVYLHVLLRADDGPRRETVDCRAYRIAMAKQIGIDETEKVLIASSVDCHLNRALAAYARANYEVDIRSSQGTASRKVLANATKPLPPPCATRLGNAGEMGRDTSTFDVDALSREDLEAQMQAVSEALLERGPSLDLRSISEISGIRNETITSRALDLLISSGVDVRSLVGDGSGLKGPRVLKVAAHVIHHGELYALQPQSSQSGDEVSSNNEFMSEDRRRELLFGNSREEIRKNENAIRLAEPSTRSIAKSRLSPSKKDGSKADGSPSKLSRGKGHAAHWNVEDIAGSLQRRMDKLALRLPLGKDAAADDDLKRALLDHVLDRLSHSEAIDAAAWCIDATDKKELKNACSKSLAEAGILVDFACFYDVDSGAYVKLDARKRWVLPSVDEERRLKQARAATEQARIRKIQAPHPSAPGARSVGKLSLLIDGYVHKTHSGRVQLKVFRDRQGSDGCVCHQTSTFTVDTILQRIRGIDRDLFNKGRRHDKRVLCELYEVAMRYAAIKARSSSFLRPAQYKYAMVGE